MTEDGAMTAAEWQGCADPVRLLEWLIGPRLRASVSDRKLRLFACACVRRGWDLLGDERSRMAIEVAEHFAEGNANEEALSAAMDAADAVCQERMPEDAYTQYIAAQEAARAADEVADFAAEFAVDEPAIRERTLDADLIREVFGDPFRRATLEPAWRTPTVTGLATAAYDERLLPGGELDSTRLAILADALEEAGCTAEVILDHLRLSGPHVRGCWAVDLILGKS